MVEEFAKEFDVLPSTMYLILSRGFSTKEEISKYLSTGELLDPFLIKGMKQLCERITLAKQLGDRVLIFGDYDVDGVSATAIMLKTLKKIGVEAEFYLPNRYVDGYGLTCDTIDKVAKQFSPDLIITVDCGISCAEEVEYAKSKGIEIIVTDHHEIPEKLPDTLVLNAKIDGQEYPFRELCGTGLAYKISEAVLGQKKAEEFLPIAAIATIADIVSLTGENRNIVKRGLKYFDKLPYGLKALFKDNKVSLSNPSSTDIAFKIAPKINSSGRMGDAKDSLMLYLSEDPVTVQKYLAKIKNHNQRRQELSAKVMEDCERAIKKMDLSKTRVICLASKKWDQGILGIACARLVEEYNRPVFLFSHVDGVLHGSGRSIDDINIHELLSSLKDILETFGGHTMAAGLTLKREKYEEFCTRVNAFAFEKVNEKVFIPIKYYDMEVKSEDLSERFLQELTLLEPFGCDNARPRFKISMDDVEITPRKYSPLHCDIKIGDLKLVYFNFVKKYNALRFSRYKSFIFEFQGVGKDGVVGDFDMGNYIVENAHLYTYPMQYQQLQYRGNRPSKFSYYPKEQLLPLVTSMVDSVFGTAFVAYSAYDFVAFSRSYSKENIFHTGICDKVCTGYNSLLLSPVGVDWAKNFSRIVFLSPCMDEAFIAQLNEVSHAEIFIPMEKDFDTQRFKQLDLSRETFGRIFKILAGRSYAKTYNIFDVYDQKFKGRVNFDTFYVAYLVFRELGLIEVLEEPIFEVYEVKNCRKALTESTLYNKLLLVKKAMEKK
ncbi:MAG: single-stranded-DNA-specific exonuclease RecJ [Clostridia bacterium]|nr:single-stranded-DNA-specific exonuclease RecJ [Clostridia bacterium]